MKRRSFLQHTIKGITIPALFHGFSVKAFAHPVPVFEMPEVGQNNSRALVLVQLNGGNDGLNTCIPLDNYSNYFNARSNIAIPEKSVLQIGGVGNMGLHPAMKGMQAMYNNGQLAIVQAVGYPQPNFSHFRATDIWMSGSSSSQYINNGWAGRYLNYCYPNYPADYPNAFMPHPAAIQIGAITSLALQGPTANMGMSISNPAAFYSLVNNIQEKVPDTQAGRELSYLRTVNRQTQQYASVISSAAATVKQQSNYPDGNQLANQLKIVARLIKGGLKTKVYVVSLGGFDNHADQVIAADTTTGVHANLLKTLSDAIKAFQDDLKFLDIEEQVIGMTFSEFGRRIKSNASGGTDHGAAAPVFLFGKNIVGGIIGNTPNIPNNVTVNDNVVFQHDFRSLYTTILQHWFRVDDAIVKSLLAENFPALPFVNSSAA